MVFSVPCNELLRIISTRWRFWQLTTNLVGGVRAGVAQKPDVVSVPQLARSDPARAESELATALNLRQRASLPQESEPMRLNTCTVLSKRNQAGKPVTVIQVITLIPVALICARLLRQVQAWLRHLCCHSDW
jgi:hypothetical protein